MLCVVFGRADGHAHTGGADGRVYHWEGNSLKKAITGHSGPIFAMQAVEKVRQHRPSDTTQHTASPLPSPLLFSPSLSSPSLSSLSLSSLSLSSLSLSSLSLFPCAKGFVTGGKDGKVCLWDEAFQNCLKTYDLASTAITSGGGAKLVMDHPPVRALALGQGKILVGTKNSEVRPPFSSNNPMCACGQKGVV